MGRNWPTERARAFVRGLSKTLVNRGYRLVSGFGYGVGSSMIAGALEHIYATRRGKIEDQLILRPLPGEHSSDPWDTVARRYREDSQLRRSRRVPVRQQTERRQCRPSDGMFAGSEIAKEKGLS